MVLNIYVGCTIILFVSVVGMMIGVFAAKNRRSKLWLAPILPLSTTVFVSIFMYFLFVGAKVVISPWVGMLFIFSEIGALVGCYINEHMNPKSNLIRAMVIVLSVMMVVALLITLMLTVSENIVV